MFYRLNDVLGFQRKILLISRLIKNVHAQIKIKQTLKVLKI